MNSYEKTIAKWQLAKFDTLKRDKQISLMSKKFLKYKLNIFLLQKHALVIQHWFFKLKVKKAAELKKK